LYLKPFTAIEKIQSVYDAEVKEMQTQDADFCSGYAEYNFAATGYFPTYEEDRR
jgi:hypothetical protein